MSDPQCLDATALPQMPARHKAASDDGPGRGRHGKLAVAVSTTEPAPRRMETES